MAIDTLEPSYASLVSTFGYELSAPVAVVLCARRLITETRPKTVSTRDGLDSADMGWFPSSAREWRWLWLYPTTLAIHMFEEYRGGAQFYQWVDRPPGAELTSGEFFGLTSFALVGMLALTLTMLRWESVRVLAVSVVVAFFLNSISHTINSVIAGGYTPGVLTGIVIWWPLTWFALGRCRTALPKRRFRLGLWIGAGIQLGVMATTLLFTVVL